MAITVKKKGPHKVGYGNPPKHGQFQKGQSGNPKGRPAGSKNLKTELEEELLEKIVITESGTPKNVSKQRAMIKALMAKAVQGDTRAANTLLNMFLKLAPNTGEDHDAIDFTETDLAILEDFKKDILNSAKKKNR